MNDSDYNKPLAENQAQEPQEPDEASYHGYIKSHYANLLSTKEAAEILGVSTVTLRKWRNQKICGVPIFEGDSNHGGAWYYRRERVEQLKSVYHKGVIQNIYKLANLEPDKESPQDNPSLDSQKNGAGTTSDATLQRDFQSLEPENTLSANFHKGDMTCCTDIPSKNAADFYSVDQVARILGVHKSTLSRWRNKKIFVEDKVNHYGIYLYSQDRVLEMKMFCSKGDNDGVNTPLVSNVLSATDPLAIVKRLNGGLRPSRTRVEINEKLAKVIFRLSYEKMIKLLNGDVLRIIEKRNYKNHDDILTACKILNANGYQVQRPFTLFDRFVLSVCISEWLEGNCYTTPAIIYRALVGKTDKGSNAKPSKDQIAAILDSIKILMCRSIDCTAKDLCEVLGYNEGKALSISGPLLPAIYLDASAENQSPTIFFLAEPPLLKIAQIKNQLISYDSELLNIPHQQNTPMNIEIKNYCMIRVKEIIAHKKLAPVITFNDVFAKIRIEDTHFETKMRAREFMKTFFEHLQDRHIIGAFKVTKKHGAFYSVQFTRPKKQSTENDKQY